VCLTIFLFQPAQGQQDRLTKLMLEDDGVTPRTMTAMFLYVGTICENKKAFEALEAKGKTMSACDDPAEAVPECFVAENWNGASPTTALPWRSH
jgi:hypothetical protein